MDMHVCLFNNASVRATNEWAFPLFVADGVTAVREISTKPRMIAVVDGWHANWSPHGCLRQAAPRARRQWSGATGGA